MRSLRQLGQSIADLPEFTSSFTSAFRISSAFSSMYNYPAACLSPPNADSKSVCETSSAKLLTHPASRSANC